MTDEQRAALIADVTQICIESNNYDAAHPHQPSHARKRHILRCEKCGNTKRSCIFVRRCKKCGGLMVVNDDNRN